MSDTDKIALEPVVYENVVEYVGHNISQYDKYQEYMSEIQTLFDDMETYTSSSIFQNYKRQMDRINNMISDYYNMVLQAYNNYCEIGEQLKGLDETVYLAMTAQEKYYVREIEY